MFNDLAKGVYEQGASVRAYDACARAARARMSSEPENAAALLLISYAAQLFVEAYDDQPLTAAAADEEYDQFSRMIETLDSAYRDGSSEKKLDALNKVSLMLLTPRKS